MDGVHDLGGKQGFGRVRYTLNATAFHAPWEVRAFSLYAFAVKSGIFNMDEYRHAIERMDARHYLTASYYERSLTGFLTLCVEKGVVTREELESRARGIVRRCWHLAPVPLPRRACAWCARRGRTDVRRPVPQRGAVAGFVGPRPRACRRVRELPGARGHLVGGTRGRRAKQLSNEPIDQLLGLCRP